MDFQRNSGSGGGSFPNCPKGRKFGDQWMDENNCQRFFQCADDGLHVHYCPSGLYFSDKLQYCDEKSNVDCNHSGMVNPSTTKSVTTVVFTSSSDSATTYTSTAKPITTTSTGDSFLQSTTTFKLSATTTTKRKRVTTYTSTTKLISTSSGGSFLQSTTTSKLTTTPTTKTAFQSDHTSTNTITNTVTGEDTCKKICESQNGCLSTYWNKCFPLWDRATCDSLGDRYLYCP